MYDASLDGGKHVHIVSVIGDSQKSVGNAFSPSNYALPFPIIDFLNISLNHWFPRLFFYD